MSSPYLTGVTRFLSLLALALATFLIVLDYTIANVSIPYIAGDLGVSSDQGTYVITSFAVGNAIVLPISGWLTARIGGVRLLTLSALLFVFFSWICGAAPNFSFLIVARFLQGFVSGPLIPLSQSLIISTNPPEKKNAVLAFWSTIVIAAPVIGPVLGGWISFDYSWPWIFYINIPFGLLSAILIHLTMKQFENEIEKRPIDFIGFILLAVAVTCLQIVLDKGEQWDWFGSNLICILSSLSFLSFTYLIIWELYHPTPLIDLNLFKARSFSLSIIFIGVMYAMYFGAVVLVPLWLQVSMGYNAIWAGIAVAPIGIAPLFFSTFSAIFVTKHGSLKPLLISCILFAFASFYSCIFNTNVDLKHIWISRLLTGTGIVFFIMPLIALSVRDIPLKKLPSASGIFHFIRALSGGIGTSIFYTLWIRRTAYHHERVGSALTINGSNTKRFFSLTDSLGIQGEKPWELLNMLLDKQAAMLALNDCFYLMGILFLLLILLLPIGRRRPKELSLDNK